MLTTIILAVVTVLSVVFALRKKRPLLLALPFVALFGVALVKIMMVPMPFWETVQFIFNLRG
ncbi:hypothetical protein SAMN05192559_101477 [Halobacillus karajensis]|uniref:Uncharacterized protein n=1 Tax=Halobacillus karajensis TaxID=195088 RepID=A0A059NX01_9BACI|nr:hypothetical protein [Halobacillus karajensis]CDQ18886.1 hypothetical protein BN982_01167 [Halobacillus karajensis]CDQ23041.1 hypothetical protein BN983_01260 [Halobacillus karajensis]CDQ26523.1 hypothetical protein BN981_00740 [Halobacillus karajensis]SEH44778.1 hypothetical protein SAMN05192559_101477 [Halobacillus karajensis]